MNTSSVKLQTMFVVLFNYNALMENLKQNPRNCL